MIEPNVLKVEEIDGYKRVTGEFWTAMQRQMHSIHYAVSYRASFKPELPNYFIQRYCSDPQRDIVLDPFGGRGTTILQANIRGYAGISNDVNPLSERIACPKCSPVMLAEIEDVLDLIDLKIDIDSIGYERFAPFYDFDTYREIVALKHYLADHRSDADRFIEMIALSRLHGHSQGFFSVYSFPQISVPTSAQTRINLQRNQTPEYRPIKPRILKKAKRVLKDFSADDVRLLRESSGRNMFTCHDSRDMSSIESGSVALIITSPPFLNVADYIQDNWIEFWFLGIDQQPLRNQIVQTMDLAIWSEFMRESIREMFRVLRPGGTAVIEVGEVRNKGKLVNLEEVIVEMGRSIGFVVDEVLINCQRFTKLANCFNVDNMTKGTNTNRLTVLRKP